MSDLFGIVDPQPQPEPEELLPEELSAGDYLIELGRRVERHAKDRCTGEQATREIGMAGMLLRKFGEDQKRDHDNAAT